MLDELKQQLQTLAANYKEIISQKVAELKSGAAASKTIKGSVGLKGQNQASDVLLVKTLLNQFGAGLDPANVTCGPKTIEAIKKFQTENAGIAKPDGLISPNGKTWKALNGETVAPPSETPQETAPTTPKETTPETPPTPTPLADTRLEDGKIEKGPIPSDFVRISNQKEVSAAMAKAAVFYLNYFCKTYPAATRAPHYGEFIRFVSGGKEYAAHFEIHTIYGADVNKPQVPHPSIGLFKHKDK